MHYTDDELFDGDVDASSDVLLTPSIAQRLRILLCGHCLGQSQRNGMSSAFLFKFILA